MKRAIVQSSLVIAMALSALPIGNAMANTASTEQTAESIAFNARTNQINRGVALLENVRAGAVAYFMASNHQWPASTDALLAAGYISTVSTPWGANVAGGVNGNNYVLNLAMPTNDIATGVAGRLGGAVNNTVVSLNVPIPATASIMDGALVRYAVAGRPELNRMSTDIDMNSFSINNVQVLNGAQANLNSLEVLSDATFGGNVAIAGSVSANSANITGTIFAADANITGKMTSQEVETVILKADTATLTSKLYAPEIESTSVKTTGLESVNIAYTGTLQGPEALFDNATVTSLTTMDQLVNNSLKVNGPSEFVDNAVFQNGLTAGQINSQGNIQESGQFLHERYLGITATAVNSSSLGGIDAAQYARLDVPNAFVAHQNFSQGLTTNGLISSGKIFANGGLEVAGGGVDVNGAYDVRVGSISMKQMYSDLQAVKNASSGAAKSGRWIYKGQSYKFRPPSSAAWLEIGGNATNQTCPVKGQYGIKVASECSGSNSNNTTCSRNTYWYYCG